mgnify:CR=1 FL=1
MAVPAHDVFVPVRQAVGSRPQAAKRHVKVPLTLLITQPLGLHARTHARRYTTALTSVFARTLVLPFILRLDACLPAAAGMYGPALGEYAYLASSVLSPDLAAEFPWGQAATDPAAGDNGGSDSTSVYGESQRLAVWCTGEAMKCWHKCSFLFMPPREPSRRRRWHIA